MTDIAASSLASDVTPAVPAAYRGVWRRVRLEGPDIATDESSTVLWLQTARSHADLRLQPERPASLGARRNIASCSREELAWLACQQGFSGITVVTDEYCEWLRDVDFQPPRPGRDIGRMVFSEDGARLEEYGVEAEYHETWEKLPESMGPGAVWRARDGRRLLIAGRCFFFVRPRAVALSPAPSLSMMVADAPMLAPARLGMELSFGREDVDGNWRIAHSTLPWCEGLPLDLGDAPEWRCLEEEPGAARPPVLRD